MENKPKKPVPTPEERPDLYDYYDGIDRPEGYQTGVWIPDRIQKLIDERQRALGAADGPKLIYIENEGALFRGSARAWPKEVWDGSKFTPYTGQVPKGIEWGHVIDENEAKRLMGIIENN
jgi:hypothetical protein